MNGILKPPFCLVDFLVFLGIDNDTDLRDTTDTDGFLDFVDLDFGDVELFGESLCFFRSFVVN